MNRLRTGVKTESSALHHLVNSAAVFKAVVFQL